jgi:hypothetical protein
LVTQFLSQPASGEAVLQIEGLVRTAVFKHANDIVAYLLQAAANRIDDAYRPAPGQWRKGRESIQVQCLFGAFTFERDYYYSARTGGYYPADAALGMEAGHTPALVRLACLEGADETGFEKAERHLWETGGIRLQSRQIQRLVQKVGPTAQAWQQREYRVGQEERTPVPIMYVSADGSGVPMRKEELRGRAGKQPDGTAKTRQAYLGCVFTQHRVDEKGRPVRDWESTTYLSSMDSSDQFGPMLRAEALRRGLAYAGKIVLLIDGAHGLENLGLINFKDAVQIVDFYHALEHAGKVLVALLGSKEHPDYTRRRGRWAKRLLSNGVVGLIAAVREESAGTDKAERVEKELNYFVQNVDRMQYGTFRRLGYFIGSGVIEAGCKTVIGARCKQSGMFWGKPGAENILALRCINASRRDDAFWKHRIAQMSAAPQPTRRVA